MDTDTCLPCTGGHMCYGTTNTAFPTVFSQHRGELCPKGFYCPEGTLEPMACPSGTYNPVEGMSSID